MILAEVAQPGVTLSEMCRKHSVSPEPRHRTNLEGDELLSDFRLYVSAFVDHSDHLQGVAVEQLIDMVLLDDEATHGREAKVFAAPA